MLFFACVHTYIDWIIGQAMSKRKFEPNATTQLEVFVSNIAAETTALELKAVFSVCGAVVNVTLPCDKTSIRGFGFVQFQHNNQVEMAIEQLNGCVLHGKRLKVRQNRGRVPLARKQALQRRRVLKSAESTLWYSRRCLKDGDADGDEVKRECGSSLARAAGSGIGPGPGPASRAVSRNRNTVHFGNLPFDLNKKGLREAIFQETGCYPISCRIIYDKKGSSRGFGYSDFECAEFALYVIEKMNGCLVKDRVIRVDIADRYMNETLKRMPPKCSEHEKYPGELEFFT